MLFKIFVYRILAGQTSKPLHSESEDLTNKVSAEMSFNEKIAQLKKDAGVFFGFGDTLEVVLEQGHYGKDRTLGGFWLKDETVKTDLIQF